MSGIGDVKCNGEWDWQCDDSIRLGIEDVGHVPSAFSLVHNKEAENEKPKCHT